MHVHTYACIRTHTYNEIHSWMNTLQHNTTKPTSVADRPRVYKGTVVLVHTTGSNYQYMRTHTPMLTGSGWNTEATEGPYPRIHLQPWLLWEILLQRNRYVSAVGVMWPNHMLVRIASLSVPFQKNSKGNCSISLLNLSPLCTSSDVCLW